MGNINLEDLKPGMVLVSDVMARNGRMLLPAKNELTEKHIGIFKAWGVTEADIEGIERDDIVAAAMEKIDPKLLKKAEEAAMGSFRHANLGHPFVAELFRICKTRLALQFQNREAK